MNIHSGSLSPGPATYIGIPNDSHPSSRMPSPTPSEIAALNQRSLFDVRSMFRRDEVFARKRLLYYVIGTVILVVFILSLVYINQIVHVIQPAANWMHAVPGGWLIPIAVFFIISFPPLFGHEILAIVCGVVWGVWIGFGITAAGTVLGEIGNFYTFRYILRSRAKKMENEDIQYACLAKLVREGGIRIPLIVRYSAVPGHFTTAIFSVCGMNIFVFIIAAILSMPKQLLAVYIGTLVEDSTNKSSLTKNTIISVVVGFLTFIVTTAAMWYVRREINKVKPEVIYARRKARQARLNGGVLYQHGGLTGSTDDDTFGLGASSVHLISALAHSDAPYDSPNQQRDRDDRKLDDATGSHVLAPRPHPASSPFDVVLAGPGSAGSAPSTGLARQASTDTTRWALQSNAADGPAHSLHPNPEPRPPAESLLETASLEMVALPSELPPARSPSAGGYNVSSPRHLL